MLEAVLGKPDVRNFREGGWKRGLWRNCDPTLQPKERGWKPSAYGCAREYPKLCVSGLAHSGFRYGHVLKRSAYIIAN